MKKNCCCILLLFALVLLGAENPYRIEKTYDPSLKVVHYLPDGMFGIYDKNEKVTFSLVLKSEKDANAEIDYSVLDYYGKTCSSTKVQKELKASNNTEIRFNVPQPGRYGHFTLDTRIRLNGKLAVVTQSAFAVIPPAVKKADPFFELDGRNGHNGVNLLPAFHRIGVGTFALTAYRDPTDPALFIRTYFDNPQQYKFENYTGYIGLPGPGYNEKKALERTKKGLYPFTDEDYAVFEKSVRTAVRAAKGQIQLWDVIQEVDAWMEVKREISAAALMADHVIRVKIFARVVREEAPGSKVALVNSCGDDFFHNDFRIVRMLLKETAKDVDYFSIDGYSGTWNGLLNQIEGPEVNDKYTKLMNSCITTAAEFGLPAEVYQAERGYFIPYMDALNSPKSHDQANMNIRSMIITRFIPGIKRYSQHGSCMWYLPDQIVRKGNPDSFNDNGMWRSVHDAKRKFSLQPRPALCAYATVARMLAYVSDPKEFKITKEIYSYHFKRPDEKRVIAIWTTGAAAKTSFHFPVDVEITDLMGNTDHFGKGDQTITVSQAPCFIVAPLNAEEVTSVLKKISFPDIKAFKAFARTAGPDAYDVFMTSFNNQDLQIKVTPGNGRKAPGSVLLKAGATAKFRVTGEPGKVELSANGRTETVSVPYDPAIPVNYGNKPQKLVTLKYPQDIRPLSALRAERNLFRCDGTDISADFAASWDKDFLYLEFTVLDLVHIQRQTGNSIWKDDCIQFAVDACNSALPNDFTLQKGYDSSIHLFGLALTKMGPFCYAWQNGKASPGTRTFKTFIEHKKGITLYRTAIPWKAIAPVKPVKGSAFGFSFIVMDNNHLSFRSAQYHLCWTEGIAGGQDASKFKTLILQ